MNCFKIPTNKLKLFLIALDFNFGMTEPDYIFQVPDGFEIVYTSLGSKKWPHDEINEFADKLWKEV